MEWHRFTATLWLWDARRKDTWVFVTLPEEVSQAVEDASAALGPRAGFGSMRVEVRVGTTTWRTSVFPDKASGLFVLPVKRSVREAVGVRPGDPLTVHMRVL